MKKKYNTKSIMNRAWELRREQGLTMGAAMKAAWAEAKAAAGVTPMDDKAHELFHAMAELDKWKAIVEELQGGFKNACAESPDGKISGFGWKASYQNIKGHRFDSKALKADDADLFNRYYVETNTMRFNFGVVAVSV